MKKNRFLLAGFWSLVGSFWLIGTGVADMRFDKGLLFAVGGTDGPPCHLFGTIHSEDPRVLDLPPGVETAFDNATVFVMEAIPDTQAIEHSMAAMMYADGRTLDDVIGRGLFVETVDAMSSLGMPEAAIRGFKPWAVATLLSVPPAETGDFLDMYLYKAALAAGKEVVGLETMDEQLAVFDNLTEREQVALLRQTLETRDQLPEVFERLIGAYLARDLAELQRLSDEVLRGGDPQLAERIEGAALDVRNRRMAQRMAPLVQAGGCFIAVGVLHLPGDGGILKRLQSEGYQVRPTY